MASLAPIYTIVNHRGRRGAEWKREKAKEGNNRRGQERQTKEVGSNMLDLTYHALFYIGVLRFRLLSFFTSPY